MLLCKFFFFFTLFVLPNLDTGRTPSLLANHPSYTRNVHVILLDTCVSRSLLNATFVGDILSCTLTNDGWLRRQTQPKSLVLALDK